MKYNQMDTESSLMWKKVDPLFPLVIRMVSSRYSQSTYPSASVFMFNVILNGPIWSITSEMTTLVLVGETGEAAACKQIHQ